MTRVVQVAVWCGCLVAVGVAIGTFHVPLVPGMIACALLGWWLGWLWNRPGEKR